MFRNEGVTFYTSGTVLEWDCHMLIISFPLVSYISMQFSDAHAGHLETGLRLRNPDFLYPILISDQPPPVSYQHSPSTGTTILHPVHPVETVLYKVFQVWKPWDHLAPIRAQMRRETNVITKCFASVEACTVHLVLPVSLQRCKDLPMHFFSF